MNVRQLATGLAVNRLLFGASFVAAPERSSRSWISIDAATGGGRVMTRATGARDLALGLVSDATDLLATWAERRELPAPSVAYALTMAGASTAIATAYLASAGARPAS